MQSVDYRGYVIQVLRKGGGAFVVNIFPMNQVNTKSKRGPLPGGHDQLIKLSDSESGMYRRFFNQAEAMQAAEQKVDAILRIAPTKSSRYLR